MAMGTRRRRDRQEEFWYRGDLAEAPGHPFYTKLSEVLRRPASISSVKGVAGSSITRDWGVRRWRWGLKPSTATSKLCTDAAVVTET
jgi:hypothetical protein